MKIIVVFLLLLFLGKEVIKAQSTHSKIDELLKAYHERSNLEGAILVGKNGEIIYQKGFGLANRQWNIPNKPDVVYDVGSLTKTFTAVITLMLVEQKLVNLQGKITDYLPGYRPDTGSKISIHHLLSQSSGLPPYWTREFVRTHAKNEFDTDYFIKTFCSGDLEFQPGTNARYSDTNYYLLGRIIEAVTNKNYSLVLQEMIFEKLGMQSSGYLDPQKVIPKMASGYIFSNESYTKGAYNNRKNADAAGAGYSSVQDLFLFDKALHVNTLLSEHYQKLLFETQAKLNLGRRKVDYGYGWQLMSVKLNSPDREIKVANAGGNNEGFTALIYRIPSEKYFIAILTNSGPDYFNEQLHEIGQNIISILFDQHYSLPKKSTAGFLASHLTKYGITETENKLKALIDHEDYEQDERAINRLGYNFMRQGKFEEAIFVFKMNVRFYPQSANVYDSLAEAYMAHGNKELSIQNYQQSLKLDPRNENAKAMLNRLKKVRK